MWDNLSMKANTFESVCSAMAARNCWESGQSLTEIAKSAGVTVGKVKKWIATSYGGSDTSWIKQMHPSHR
jgi:hypothetical protein